MLLGESGGPGMLVRDLFGREAIWALAAQRANQTRIARPVYFYIACWKFMKENKGSPILVYVENFVDDNLILQRGSMHYSPNGSLFGWVELHKKNYVLLFITIRIKNIYASEKICFILYLFIILQTCRIVLCVYA